jgi:hypothetical protein
MDTIFEKPDQAQVKEWYEWLFSLNNQKNPFHPTEGGQFWDVNNNNQNLIWLAGVIATTAPAKAPTEIADVNVIVQGSQAKTEYNDGNGNPVLIPSISPRDISFNKGDNRDLFVPVSTELAHEKKFPKLANNLSQLAQEIADRDSINGVLPAFVEFQDAVGNNKQGLNGNQLKTGFRVDGTFDNLDVLPDNIAMLPTGNGRAAFSDYSVILKHDALKPGKNKLRMGTWGQFFAYTVVYTINV